MTERERGLNGDEEESITPEERPEPRVAWTRPHISLGEFRRRFGLSQSECDWLLSEGRVATRKRTNGFGMVYQVVSMVEVRRYIRVMARPAAERWVEIPNRDAGQPKG